MTITKDVRPEIQQLKDKIVAILATYDEDEKLTNKKFALMIGLDEGILYKLMSEGLKGRHTPNFYLNSINTYLHLSKSKLLEVYLERVLGITGDVI